MSTLKSLAKEWLPPPIVRAIKNLGFSGIRFEGEFISWDAAAACCSGYDAKHILEKVLDATLKVKKGEAAYERDSVLFDNMEYAWPVTTGLMWAAAFNGGRLDVLDFGGALGSSYFQNLSFLQVLPEVKWNVIEQLHYVETGQSHIQDETLRFYLSIKDCLIEHRPNVALLSSVLQYLPEVNSVIDQISASGASIMINDRTPFTDNSADGVCIQIVPKSIYNANYPMRYFALDKFLNMISNDWRIITNTISPEGTMKTNIGRSITFQSFILQRKNV